MADPRLIWIAWVLAATVAVLAITRADAVSAPTCEEIREAGKQYTFKQIKDMAKRAKLTKEQFAAVMGCVGDKK